MDLSAVNLMIAAFGAEKETSIRVERTPAAREAAKVIRSLGGRAAFRSNGKCAVTACPGPLLGADLSMDTADPDLFLLLCGVTASLQGVLSAPAPAGDGDGALLAALERYAGDDLVIARLRGRRYVSGVRRRKAYAFAPGVPAAYAIGLLLGAAAAPGVCVFRCGACDASFFAAAEGLRRTGKRVEELTDGLLVYGASEEAPTP